jgi:hypothetical protein
MCSNEEEQLDEKLYRIDTSADELNVKIARSRLDVDEHCGELARRVDLAIELRIQQLNKLRAKWLKQIKDYEAECMRNMDATRQLLIESVERAKQWSKSIRDMERKRNFLVELNDQADAHLGKLNLLHQQIKGFQFGGKLMTFYADEKLVEYEEESTKYSIDEEYDNYSEYDDEDYDYERDDDRDHLKQFGFFRIQKLKIPTLLEPYYKPQQPALPG